VSDLLKCLRELEKFSEDQPRAANGEFGEGGGGKVAEESPAFKAGRKYYASQSKRKVDPVHPNQGINADHGAKSYLKAQGHADPSSPFSQYVGMNTGAKERYATSVKMRDDFIDGAAQAHADRMKDQ
jgi:hypothetical protein